MAHQLGVSRNAIWKAVKALQAEGYLIEASPNRGYRLQPENDVLFLEGIRQFFSEELLQNPIEIHKKIDSTNQRARILAAEGQPHGMVVLAEEQTQGRGRKGRSFYSPAGQGLYLSIILRPEMPLEEALTTTVVAAVAAVEAIEETIGVKAEIKWVNDLFYHGKKVGGILTEASTRWESGEVEYVVLGIGLNLYEPTEGFPQDLHKIVGAMLKRDDMKGVRNKLASKLIEKVLAEVRRLTREGTSAREELMGRYRRASNVLGKEVMVLDHPVLRQGKAVEIDDHGGLWIEDQEGARHHLMAGEISIRPLGKD